ncbi:hypothetical protein C8J56DRAFT_1168107 [Mycena floridula]|nr:hypothetical protein C8J56DRAFT_1168107 [Mycena floridula]
MPFKIVHLLKRKAKPARVDDILPSVDSLPSETLQRGFGISGSISQSLHGATIGNVNGPWLSNNCFTTVNHHHYHEEDCGESNDYHLLKAADLILESQLRSQEKSYDLLEDGTLQEKVKVTKYRGRVINQPTARFLIYQYEGTDASSWKRDFNVFSGIRHPNIPQLYGLCRSTGFRALVFHNMSPDHRMTFIRYHEALSGIQFITYIVDTMDQFTSAWQLLRSHNVAPVYYVTNHNVDTSGAIVVDRFLPFDEPAIRAFNRWCLSERIPPGHSILAALTHGLTNHSFKKSELHLYYQLLAGVCRMHYRFFTKWGRHFDLHCSDHHQRVLVPVAMEDFATLKPGLGDIPEKLSGELLPDMSIRFTIPTAELITMRQFSQVWQLVIKNPNPQWGHNEQTMFPICFSQIHHLIKNLKTDDSKVPVITVPSRIHLFARTRMDIRRPPWKGPLKRAAVSPPKYDVLYLFFSDLFSQKPKSHWSIDPEGLDEIDKDEVEDASGENWTADIYWENIEIPPQMYPIFREIHEGCGFDPDSIEMAEYLGYPLLDPVEERVSPEPDFWIGWLGKGFRHYL